MAVNGINTFVAVVLVIFGAVHMRNFANSMMLGAALAKR